MNSDKIKIAIRPGQNEKRRMDTDILDTENFWHRSMLDARSNLIEASKTFVCEMRNGIHRIYRHRKILVAQKSYQSLIDPSMAFKKTSR